MYVNRKLSLNDLYVMRHACHFDLVLGLSVLHHVRGQSLQWVEAMRGLGRFVMIETALQDSARAIKKGVDIPDGGAVIGHGTSHLKKGFQRPILVYGGYRT